MNGGGGGVALFFGFIIVVTIGWILLSRAMDTTFDALFRTLFFRRTHKTGEYLIQNPLIFKTQANFDTLKKRIFNDIVPPDRNTSWASTLYLAEAGMNSNGEYVAKFRKDSKLNSGLEVEVKLRQDAAGVVGSVDVLRWRLVDSVIQHVNDMKMLRQRVEQIVLSLDPYAQLSHRSGAVAPTVQQPFAPAGQSFSTPQHQPGPPRPSPGVGYAPTPVSPQRPSATSAKPFSQTAPPTSPQASRYPVPDTSSWVDRSQA
jgi:hypothetical protein